MNRIRKVDLFSILWLGWALLFIVIETIAIKSKREKCGTFSTNFRSLVFHDHFILKYITFGIWTGIFLWFSRHIWMDNEN